IPAWAHRTATIGASSTGATGGHARPSRPCGSGSRDTERMTIMSDDLVLEVVRLALTILAPVLAALGSAVLVKMFQRVGLEVSAEKQARLEKIAQDAIFGAEEWAAGAIKRNLPVPSGAKLNQALARFLMRAPGVSEDEAAAIIHAELPKVGLGAVGFLRAVRQAAATPSTSQ